MKSLSQRAVIGVLAAAAIFAASAVSAAPLRRIVVFRAGATTPGARDAAVRRAGGTPVRDLAIVHGAAAILPAAAERALLRRADVLRIDPDLRVEAIGKADRGKPPKNDGGGDPPAAPLKVVPWGVTRIDAPTAWAASRGAGIKVAVLDTGIDYEHPDLQANYAGGINITSSRKPPKDDNGHGTHVAGTIAAADNDIGVVGVAPAASLYAVKVLSRSGSGWISDIIAGLQWCVEQDMDVANMSLGLGTDVASFREACEVAASGGVILVAAAGNDGGPVGYPAAYGAVIAVSATGADDLLAWWSSRGPEVDFAAPGVAIYSTTLGGGYGDLSGTSMASPHVAGVAALALAAGDATSNAVLAGEDIGLSKDAQGQGLIDAAASVQ